MNNKGGNTRKGVPETMVIPILVLYMGTSHKHIKTATGTLNEARSSTDGRIRAGSDRSIWDVKEGIEA